MVSKKGNVDANVISVDGGRDDKCQKNKILYICYNQYEYRVYLCVYISTHTQTNCSKTNRVEFHELVRFRKNIYAESLLGFTLHPAPNG